jgi:hypothetical protein
MVFLPGVFVLILEQAISGQQSAISKNKGFADRVDNGRFIAII